LLGSGRNSVRRNLEISLDLFGQTGWQWLHIEILSAEEGFRGQGLGSRLLTSVAAKAMERGCTGVYLETFEIQALPFYRRHDYDSFGVLEDYPPVSRCRFLRKALTAGARRGVYLRMTCSGPSARHLFYFSSGAAAGR
jgi:GNAT superfamily N-acetyltransferase